MEALTKRKALVLAGALFGWAWIFGRLAAVGLFVAALFHGGAWWLWFVGTLAGSAVGKWLMLGFRDSADRVAYIEALQERGASLGDAREAWLARYSGTPEDSPIVLAELGEAEQLVSAYLALLDGCVGERLQDESRLPAPKANIEGALFRAARHGLCGRPPLGFPHGTELRIAYAALMDFVPASEANRPHAIVELGAYAESLLGNHVERVMRTLKSREPRGPALERARTGYLDRLARFDSALLTDARVL